MRGRPRSALLSECTPAIAVAEVPWPALAEGLKVLPPVDPSRRMSWLHRYQVVVLDLCSHSVAKIVATDGHRRREAARRERAQPLLGRHFLEKRRITIPIGMRKL